MIKKYMPYIKPYKKQVLSTVVLIALEVALGVYIPFLMGKIIDVGIPSGHISVVLHYGIMMVIMAALALACGATAARTSSVASMGFGSKIREALFQKILGFSFANTDHFGTSSLVMRLTTDVSNTQQAFMMIIRICVRAPLSLICATLMAARINSALVAVFFVAIPLLFLIIVLLAKLGYPHFMSMLKIYDGLNGSVQENLIGIRVVKSFVRENHEKEKFAKMNDALKDASIRAEKLIILSMPLFQLMAYACIVAVLWFGGKFVIRSEMLSGELLSFVSYTTQIMMSLMMLSMVFVMIVISKASMQRIVSVLDETIDITDESADAGLKVQDGSVEFKNVCFKYDKDASDYVLSDVNLKIASGETVGIIGGTGSAKTTLAQLIPRLYDVSEGRVLVGGADVKSYKLNNLNDAVGMVLQKNILFSGTIRENLKWGNENATDEEITAACKTAQAHDFIMSFPDGYDTYLGQGGVNVSGGQKQRLCIARALLKQPKILILDDSTSAVDTATEEKIKQAFEHDFDHLTRIIIAQRIHSVMDADKIIVIDDGKIDTIGTHAELLKTNTIYREVYESQQKGVGE